MQSFGVTNKEHYGMLRYFLEWSILNHELSKQDHDVTAQIWGPTYTQIWSKMQILESYVEFESFCSKCIGVALEPIVELHTF